MDNGLVIFLVTIFIATILNILLKRIGVPTIIGYILAGISIGQLFDFDGANTQKLSHIAEFGIVFLMFTVGLEFSLQHLKAMKKEVFLFGFLQVFVTGNVFGAILHEVFSIEIKSAIIIGFSLSLSSTAIILKMLNSTGDLHRSYGRISLGILLFQDIAVIPILLMISVFSAQSASIEMLLLITLIDAVIVLFILFVIGKMVIERVLRWITYADSEEIFLISVLLIVLSTSYLAHIFGFSYSLGAFIAGMVIAETKYKYRIEADLIPFRDLLLGVFFVTVGMLIDIDIISAYWHIIVLLVVGFSVMKAMILFAILNYFVQSRTAFKSAFTLFQIGEFAIAILSLANVNGIIDDRVSQILIVTVIITMFLTPFILNNTKKIADRFFTEPEPGELISTSGNRDHIIICGYGPLGQKIVKELKALGIRYVIIEHDLGLVEDGETAGEPIFLGNAAQRHALEALDIKEAFAVIVAIDNLKKLRLICEAIDSFDMQINTIVKVRNQSHKEVLEGLNINHIVNESEEMARTLIKEALTCKVEKITA
jgi:CPA2 family monovalent cation:H+ antiporter-2